MKKKVGIYTEKTLCMDLRNLMAILNLPVPEYELQKDDFRIRYDGIEEERRRMTGIPYIHEFISKFSIPYKNFCRYAPYSSAIGLSYSWQRLLKFLTSKNSD